MTQRPKLYDAKSVNLSEITQGSVRIIDTYEEQLEDLFLIRNPKYRFDKNYAAELSMFKDARKTNGNFDSEGTWVHFPWSNTLVHYLSDSEHQEVRTARNKNIITEDEQKRYYGIRVAVAGLSVGSHGTLTLALAGGARTLKIADMDTISASNLNRLRFDFTHIGRHKGELIAEYIYQLNPYSDITLYKEGVSTRNISDFLSGVDVLVEELDDLEIKIQLRREAKSRGIPVIMATDSSDNVILDVERYDLNPNLEIFNGALRGMDLNRLKDDRALMFQAMGRIIDLRLVTERSLDTVREVGKSIYSWPQLATAATASGAVIAYAVRRIALGQALPSGKTILNLDAQLDPDYSATVRAQRRKLRAFMRAMRPRVPWYGYMQRLWSAKH